jgi:hypothetical protein
MADARDSKSRNRKIVWVQVPPPAVTLPDKQHQLLFASVAQLDRASVFGTEGLGFESLQAQYFG